MPLRDTGAHTQAIVRTRAITLAGTEQADKLRHGARACVNSVGLADDLKHAARSDH